jgi:GPH family glycoside/pentoside/hexuronide:cation symporter
MKKSSKLGYGIGQMSGGVMAAAGVSFLFFYYNQVLGLAGGLAGLATMIALSLDALSDPMVGQISDNWRSRWGRRHPFMLAGALAFPAMVILLFNPPADLSQLGLFSWYLFWAISVRVIQTLFLIPYLALGAELVSDYHERTSLIGYRVFFAGFGSLIVSVVGYGLFFPTTAEYANGMLNADNYPRFGIFVGALATTAMLWCVIATRKIIPQLHSPTSPKPKRHPSLAVIVVFQTLREQAFRALFMTKLSFYSLAGVSLTLIVYIASYVFGFSSENLALISTSPIFGMLAASSIAQAISLRLDKRLAAAYCAVLGATLSSVPLILFLLGAIDTFSLGEKVFLVYFFNMSSGGFMIAFGILLDSMLTDTVDQHELHTSKREEGLFFAASSFAVKAGFGLGSLFAGIALDAIAFPVGMPPSEVAPETINRLAILGGPLLTALFGIVPIIIRRYPLDATKSAQIQQALNTQKATAAGL